MSINSILSLLLIIVIMYSNIGQCLLNGNEVIWDAFKYETYVKNQVFTSCSGVVIDEWHILTAAHCVYRNKPEQLTVLAGSTLLVRHFVNIHEVQEIHVHRDYDTSLKVETESWSYHPANDIAILTLESPLLLGANIEKVVLPTKDTIPCTPIECMITGWGVSQGPGMGEHVRLFWAEAIIVSPYYCQIFGISLWENELCVTDTLEIARAHDVDSGSGLVCDGVLVGIITTHNRPIVNANVYSFLPFINEIREKDHELYCFFPPDSPQ